MLKKLFYKLFPKCEHQWNTYSYTTKQSIVDGQEVTEYATRKSQCNKCRKWTILKG